MANCHDLLQKFYEEISLDQSKEEALVKARNAIRKRIKEYFKDVLKYTVPNFWGQGSYMMRTSVNPINGDYDIDDGVYLANLDKDMVKWPAPEIIHGWILAAVEKHTDKKPIDKRTCVRVVYSGKPTSYHVDLPIYSFYENDLFLAEKGEKGWHISDPRAITDWFNGEIKKNGQQLRSLVKYLKAWADYQSTKNGTMTSGLIITVLISNNYVSCEDRDDISLAKTITNIAKDLSSDFEVPNPVDTEEILSDRLSDPRKEVFCKLISDLAKKAENAIKEANKKIACRIWREEFGNRFSNCDKIADDKGALYTAAPALLKNDARSAKEHN